MKLRVQYWPLPHTSAQAVSTPTTAVLSFSRSCQNHVQRQGPSFDCIHVCQTLNDLQVSELHYTPQITGWCWV